MLWLLQTRLRSSTRREQPGSQRGPFSRRSALPGTTGIRIGSGTSNAFVYLLSSRSAMPLDLETSRPWQSWRVAANTSWSVDPAGLLELIERERLNYLAGFVTHFQLLFRGADVDAYDLSSLEYIWWGRGADSA